MLTETEAKAEVRNREHIGTVVSNFDHQIHEDVAEMLKSGNTVADYPGWNFHGTVWFNVEEQLYRCAVMQYQQFAEIIESPTLEALKEAVCEKYGND